MKKVTNFLPNHNSKANTHHTCNHKFNIFLFFLLLACIGLCAVFHISQTKIPVVSNKFFLKKITNTASHPFAVVIDPGHGGKDPGKVGSSETLEKDINLKIALYLKEILEAQDIHVIMTRTEDKDLSNTSVNFKISDMKKRVDLIKESAADLVISIHQNSYTDPDVYGAQCFYHDNSTEGKQLADIIQKQIIISTKQTKIREIKGNTDYYLLKYSPIPTVIVECGFLSNPQEEQLLLSEEYQRKMAWGIHLGILQYLNTTIKSS